MKDVKVQNIQPVADPKATQKTGRKEELTGPSFNEALNTAVARMGDLNAKIQQEPAGKIEQADPTSMKEEITAAKEKYDQLMLEKQNLARLYQRLTNKDDS